MAHTLSNHEVMSLICRFDLEWDLVPNYEGFESALRGLGIAIDDVFSQDMVMKNAISAAVLRCLLDMYDRQFDLGRASCLEPYLEAELNTSLATWPEEGARARDVLGRLAYRRGSYVLAEERFNEAICIAREGDVPYLLPDLTSNRLRARFELQRLGLGENVSSPIHYTEALEAAGWTDDASVPIASESSRQEILRQRGMASLLHNLLNVARNLIDFS